MGNFKFMLFVAFQNEADSVGLDICRMLVKIQELLNIDSFKLVERISVDAAGNRVKDNPRWGDKFCTDVIDGIIDTRKE